MDIKRIQKISTDKIESDLYTNNVRQKIRQNIREKQDSREAFKDAFEVLLETQESSTKTQKDILEELKKLNSEMRENIQEQGEANEELSEEEELSEQSEAEDDNPRPHMRLPGLLYRGFKGLVSRVDPSNITSLIRNGLIGTAGIASAILATQYLGEQLSDRTGNEQFGTSFDNMEPTVNALKDNLYKLSTETALTIYNQANSYPESKADISGLSNLIYKGIIGSAGANAALAAYRLIADKLSFDQISRFISKIKTGLKGTTKPLIAPSLKSSDIFETKPLITDQTLKSSDIFKTSQLKSSDIIKPPIIPDLTKPSKNPINLFDLPQNQPIIPDTFASYSKPQNQPIIPDTFAPFFSSIKPRDKPLLPRPPAL